MLISILLNSSNNLRILWRSFLCTSWLNTSFQEIERKHVYTLQSLYKVMLQPYRPVHFFWSNDVSTPNALVCLWGWLSSFVSCSGPSTISSWNTNAIASAKWHQWGFGPVSSKTSLKLCSNIWFQGPYFEECTGKKEDVVKHGSNGAASTVLSCYVGPASQHHMNPGLGNSVPAWTTEGAIVAVEPWTVRDTPSRKASTSPSWQRGYSVC